MLLLVLLLCCATLCAAQLITTQFSRQIAFCVFCLPSVLLWSWCILKISILQENGNHGGERDLTQTDAGLQHILRSVCFVSAASKRCPQPSHSNFYLRRLADVVKVAIVTSRPSGKCRDVTRIALWRRRRVQSSFLNCFFFYLGPPSMVVTHFWGWPKSEGERRGPFLPPGLNGDDREGRNIIVCYLPFWRRVNQNETRTQSSSPPSDFLLFVFGGGLLNKQ